MRFRLIATCAIAFVTAPLCAQVSFTTVIDLALKNSPRVRMAEADVNKTKAVMEEAHDVYIPAVVLGSGLGYTYGFPVGTPTLYNVTVQSLAFDMAQRNYVRSAKHAHEATMLALQNVRQEVAEDAAVTYLAISTDQQKLATLDQEQGYSDKLVALVRERLDAGQDTRMELTRSQLTGARVRLQRLQLADNLEQQRQHLSLLTGLPGAQIIADASTIPPSPSISRNAANGVSVSYTVQSADENAKAKLQQAFGDARKMYRPQVAFVAQYNRFASFNGYDEYYKNYKPNNFSVGIQLSLPIFDFGKRAKARESIADAQHAMHEATMLRQQFAESQLKTAGLVEELQARADVASLERQYAQDQLDVVQVQLTNGNPNGTPVTPKAETNARIEERSKYLDYLESDFQLRQAQFDLLRTTGQLESWIQSSLHTAAPAKP